MKQNEQPLLEHLKELKLRLIYVLVFFFISFGVGYYFVEEIYSFLLRPLIDNWTSPNKSLIYTNLTEIFFSYLRLAFYVAMFCTIPFLLSQIYIFIAPGLYKNEKKAIFPFLTISPILFLLGAIFVYYFIFPMAWKFFLSFENSHSEILPMRLEAKVSEYLSIVINLIIAFGIAFQLPVLLILLAKIGILDVSYLIKKRKFATVLIFIIAAVLTPPDAISQIGLAIVMLMLYELSIFIIKKSKKEN
jgi:sec-independent protein translocase protein TatC